MSNLTYNALSSGDGKPLVWLHGKIKTPPLSPKCESYPWDTIFAWFSWGVTSGMPHARLMKSMGKRCFELRVKDAGVNWRLVYRLDEDAIVVVGLFSKTSRATADRIVEVCRKRLSHYDAAAKG